MTDETTDGPDRSDERDDESEHREHTGARGPTGRGDRTPPGQLILREHEVYSYLVIGKGVHEIRDIVAQRVKDERKERREWEDRKQDHAERAQPFDEELPDLVWGKVPSSRTIDRYIVRAKRRLEEEGRTLSKQAEKILGIQWARINAVFHAAFEAGKYSVCARMIEITNDMFALNGAIPLPLTTPGDPDEKTTTVPETAMTEQGAITELRLLLHRGRDRMLKMRGTQN